MIINNGRVRALVAQKIGAGTDWCCDSSSCDLIKSMWQDKGRLPGQYTLALVLNKGTLLIQKLLILPHGRKDSGSGVCVRHSQGLWHWQFMVLLVGTGTFAASSSWPLIQVTVLSTYKMYSYFLPACSTPCVLWHVAVSCCFALFRHWSSLALTTSFQWWMNLKCLKLNFSLLSMVWLKMQFLCHLLL